MFAQLLTQRRVPRYGRAVAEVKTFPPPVGGWNSRDPLPAMKEGDAVTLENLIPGSGAITGRMGYTPWTTDLPAYPESLMVYTPPTTAAAEMFAATPTAIYDVSGAGAVGAAVQSGLSNGRWQHTMFATAGGTFLWMCNGEDNPRYYNGTAWTTLTTAGGAPNVSGGITEAQLQSIVSVCSHQNRLWLIPDNSTDVWYLGTSSISGAAAKISLGALLTRGSKLLAMGSWTKDGGAGMDDLAVFVSSAGEVLVYDGIDPSSADTWSLVGRFTIPQPIGRRCLIKAGSDLAIITSAGIALMSQMLSAGASQQAGSVVSDKISGAMREAYTIAATAHGWQILEFPTDQLLIVNVPVAERLSAEQFVCNMATGAWCKWTGLAAACWAMMGDRLFFARHDGTICRYGDEYTDDGEPITASYQSAYTTFKSPVVKVVSSARPTMQAPAGYTPRVQCLVDYDTNPPTIAAAPATILGSTWDLVDWDVAEWGTGPTPRAKWQTVHGQGVALSLAMRTTLFQEFVLNSVDVLYEKSAGVGM